MVIWLHIYIIYIEINTSFECITQIYHFYYIYNFFFQALSDFFRKSQQYFNIYVYQWSDVRRADMLHCTTGRYELTTSSRRYTSVDEKAIIRHSVNPIIVQSLKGSWTINREWHAFLSHFNSEHDNGSCPAVGMFPGDTTIIGVRRVCTRYFIASIQKCNSG